MSAIRLARGFTRRDRIIKFAGCYHGHSDGLLASAGSGLATLGIPSSPGVPTATTADTVVTTYNDLDATAAAVERYGEGLAAIVVEPVAGNMGVVPPAPGFLEALRALCDASGALLIFDEVITGFRVARGGAQERFGVLPDLTILGKIVGGGLPAAAFGGRADVMERLAPAGDVYQAGTLSGNPLATAAGTSVLRRLRDPAVYEELEAKGARLEAGLAPFGRVQRVGAMATLFLRDGAVRTFEDAKASDTERYGALFRHLLERGIYIAPVPVRVPLRLARPLGRGHRPHRRGRWRLLPRLTCSRRSRRRPRPRARSGARRFARDPERVPVFGALVPERFALGVETIYEGYLLHYGRPRLFAPPDEDVALLLGDYLYAHGLVRIAATGRPRRGRRARGADLGVRRPPRGGRARRRRRLGRLRPPARRRSRRGDGGALSGCACRSRWLSSRHDRLAPRRRRRRGQERDHGHAHRRPDLHRRDRARRAVARGAPPPRRQPLAGVSPPPRSPS